MHRRYPTEMHIEIGRVAVLTADGSHLSFLGIYMSTRQLSVIGGYLVSGHCLLHGCQGVGCHLVTQASAARMYHDADLANLATHNLIDPLKHLTQMFQS